jgi:hypothetical protein
MALLFTVLSFWWLHARPGRLRTYEPTTWAAYVGRDHSAIRLPLVLHNTGAAPLVVIGLRLRFVERGELMTWEWTRTRVDPKADDIEDATTPFSIPGGGTRELVAEFVGSLPGIVPEQRAYPVAIEALSSLSSGWGEILPFDLQFKNLIHPANYIVYTNQSDYLDDKQLAEGAANLAKMRLQYGLEADVRPTSDRRGSGPQTMSGMTLRLPRENSYSSSLNAWKGPIRRPF